MTNRKNRILQIRLRTLQGDLKRIQNQEDWVQDLRALLTEGGESVKARDDFIDTLGRRT